MDSDYDSEEEWDDDDDDEDGRRRRGGARRNNRSRAEQKADASPSSNAKAEEPPRLQVESPADNPAPLLSSGKYPLSTTFSSHPLSQPLFCAPLIFDYTTRSLCVFVAKKYAFE